MNIAEIAKMAGVSSAAVSRYFNNGYISEEKREAIRKAVEETGYRPSLQAQTLRTKKTKMIGVILPKINSAAMGSMVAGILSVLNKNGYQLLLADTQNNPEKELEYLSVFNDKQVDGVIFSATVVASAHKRALKDMTVPVVIIGQRLPGYHCVYHDDYHAIYDMTRFLLEKGRKNLGYIGVLMQDEAAGKERYRGYRDAVLEGMPGSRNEADGQDTARLSHMEENYVIADFTIESGYEKAKELWEKCPGLDGVVCATDSIAIGAMQYLKSQGLQIPGQVMVAGHGDSSLSKVTTPTLTTIHYSYEECGEVAANMLMGLVDKKDSAMKEIQMGYFLVENQSTEMDCVKKDME